MADPYRAAGELQERIARAAGELGQVLGRDDALARLADRDELRVLADELAAAARGFTALLDWADESTLPPGLRAALSEPGWRELAADPETGQPVAVGPNPTEVGEPLAALVHTAEMGEGYEHARLDLADIGLGELPYRFRLRAIDEELDAERGPLEHASLYLDVHGARHLAAMLFRRVAAAEHE